MTRKLRKANRLTGLVLAFAALAGVAEAKTYRMGGKSEGAAEILDVANLTKTGGTVVGWSIFVMLDKSGTGYTFYITKQEWDCVGKRNRRLSGGQYLQTGESIASLGLTAWNDIIPDSMGDQSLIAACATPASGSDTIEFENNFELAAVMGKALLGMARK